MGAKHKHLYDQIVSIRTLQQAFMHASRGKRQSHGYLVFNEYAHTNILELHKKLKNGTWTPDPLRQFYVYEPKRRLIGAPSFSDRVVHHALCSVLEPIFDRTFLPWSFACRNGKGTHAGVKFVQSQLRKGYTHYLKTDFSGYFPSIDRAILHQEVRRKITDTRVLDLFSKIVPPEGQGVPIGALTSQLSANIYGNILDQHLHHNLGVRFARYMDDVVVLGHQVEQLKRVKGEIEQFARERMKLSISRWHVAPASQGVNFLGYRIWDDHKLLRPRSVRLAKHKIKTYTRHNDLDALAKFVGSWRGHAGYADTANLRRWLDREHEVANQLKRQQIQSVKNRKDLLDLLLS